MHELLELLNELIVDHWSKILAGVLFLFIGASIGRLRARREWKTRQFKDRLNISLNFIQGSTLAIRTFKEVYLREVIRNDTAVALVQKAAKKTTVESPILKLGEDSWFVLNEVLNYISGIMGPWLLQEGNAGTQNYVLCLTYEVDGPVRTRKVRAMLMKKHMLENWKETSRLIKLASPNHQTRVNTLNALSYMWNGSYKEGFIELSLPVPEIMAINRLMVMRKPTPPPADFPRPDVDPLGRLRM